MAPYPQFKTLILSAENLAILKHFLAAHQDHNAEVASLLSDVVEQTRHQKPSIKGELVKRMKGVRLKSLEKLILKLNKLANAD